LYRITDKKGRAVFPLTAFAANFFDLCRAFLQRRPTGQNDPGIRRVKNPYEGQCPAHGIAPMAGCFIIKYFGQEIKGRAAHATKTAPPPEGRGAA
jgi:hypothetical protein